MLDNLKEYFDTHSNKEIWDSWNMTKESDNVGITMEEFITNNNKMTHTEIKTQPSIMISDEGYCDHLFIITYSGFTDEYNVVYEDAYDTELSVKRYNKTELLNTFSTITEEHLKQIK